MHLTVSTQGNYDLINITEKIEKEVAKSRVKNGLVNIFARHTTVGLTIMEWEEGTKKDLIELFERIAPQKGNYHHEKWNDGNGAAHVKSALMKPSLTVPILDGKISLGTWQNIVLIDFDVRPREREVVIQILSA